uniref:M23 family metallopeptidase n=1 Tax=Edaphosphingomonas laterariae TaxID=861865 RepID=UPI003CCBA37A
MRGRAAGLILLPLILPFSLLAGCAVVPPATAETGAVPPSPPPAPVVTPLSGDFAFQGSFQQGGLVLGTAPVGTVRLLLDDKPVRIAPGRRFIIGFGRDHGGQAMLEARAVDGTALRKPLAIAPRAWSIQSLPTLPRGTSPTPEYQRRRAAELAQINAAREVQSDTQGWQQRFQWPVSGRISGVFGSQRIYAGEPGAFHSGVDVARPTGTPIVAPADGVVILAASAPFSLEGNLLMIDHGMGLNSAFLHLSRIDVKTGDRVVRGQPVGAIGATGRATGPHLHWSMKWQDERIDPAPLAGPMPGR